MRQFILEKQVVKNGLILLEGKDFKYLRQVLRVKVGDMVNVRLPDGVLQNSTVTQIDDRGKKITLQLCAGSFDKLRNHDGQKGRNRDSHGNRSGHGSLSGQGSLSLSKGVTRGVQASEIDGVLPSIEYWLFQFLPKPQKFEQIVRQATECGVSKIVPVIGEYSEKSSVMALEGNKKERLERIIREARQQSGSPVDTKIMVPVTPEEAVNLWKENCGAGGEVAFVLSERDDCSDTLKKVISENQNIKKVAIAVGSEGGLSPDEVTLLQEKGLFYPIHFAVNILRCETAALYGIAAVQSGINS